MHPPCPQSSSTRNSARQSGFLPALCLIALAGSALLQPAEASGLLTLYQEALEYNAEYAAAQADHAATTEALPQARAQFLPSVKASGESTRTRIDNEIQAFDTTRETTHDFTSTSYGLTLNQPLYRKQLWAQYDQALARIREADARLAFARDELALRLAQAYFDTLLAGDDLRLITEQRAAIAAQLRQAERLYESGYGTITDVNEARARLDSTDAQAVAAKSMLEIRRHALDELTGRLPESLLPLSRDLPMPHPDPDDLDAWITFALDRNPAVNAALARLEAAREEIDMARAGHHPTLDLVASWRHDRDPGYTTPDTKNDVTEIGLRLNIPLFQGGQIRSRTRQAVAMDERARNELEATRRQISQRTRQEYLSVVNGIAEVRALEQALRSHELALHSMERGFEAGMRTNVDVLNQQHLLFEAKRNLLRARYEFIMSRMRLQAAAGLLDEAEIERIDGWLAAAEH